MQVTPGGTSLILGLLARVWIVFLLELGPSMLPGCLETTKNMKVKVRAEIQI